jgi:hypothetical protein
VKAVLVALASAMVALAITWILDWLEASVVANVSQRRDSTAA